MTNNYVIDIDRIGYRRALVRSDVTRVTESTEERVGNGVSEGNNSDVTDNLYTEIFVCRIRDSNSGAPQGKFTIPHVHIVPIFHSCRIVLYKDYCSWWGHRGTVEVK